MSILSCDRLFAEHGNGIEIREEKNAIEIEVIAREEGTSAGIHSTDANGAVTVTLPNVANFPPGQRVHIQNGTGWQGAFIANANTSSTSWTSYRTIGYRLFFQGGWLKCLRKEVSDYQTVSTSSTSSGSTGYKLSFDFDVNDYEASEVTRTLLRAMRKIFRTKANAFQSGAILAFESTSIPEFYVLDSLVEKCENHLRTLRRNEYTAEYIKGHKFFEIGHREGLLNAIEGYIKTDQAADFATGYLSVCVAISNWWNDLSDRITVNR
jgi:hypothetical protein